MCCKSPEAAVPGPWIAVALAIGMSFEVSVASTATGVIILRTAVCAGAVSAGAGAVSAGAGAGVVGADADFFFNTTQTTTIATITKTVTPAAAPAMIPPSTVTAHKYGRTVRNIDRHTQTAV